MLPAIMFLQREIDLHKRPPFRALWFAYEIHPRFVRCMVRLAGIARNAGADDVFPGRRAASVAWNDVVEVQIFAVKNFTAILTGIFIALKNVVPGELHFLFRQSVVHEQQNDFRHADAERNRVDGIFVRRIGGDITPFRKIKRTEGAIRIVHHHLCLTLKEERERSASGADIDCLPEPVQNQNVLV